MGIFAWIVFGLIAGVVAKFIIPDNQGEGISGFDIRSLIIAIL